MMAMVLHEICDFGLIEKIMIRRDEFWRDDLWM